MPIQAPTLHRRVVGTISLYIVGIPMIALGMLLVFSIVAYDTVDGFHEAIGAIPTPSRNDHDRKVPTAGNPREREHDRGTDRAP